MASYKVHAIEPLGSADAAFIVTTAFRNAGGFPKAEWFLVISDEQQSFFGQTVRFNVKVFPPGGIELDDEFMYREVLDQAKGRLRRYIFENKIELGRGSKAWDPMIIESNSNLFVHLWVRNLCHDQFGKLFHATECEDLKTFLKWVATLETYDRRDL